ncbi:hypothetical protein CRM22_000624, partial [Opisthorchis felineus]
CSQRGATKTFECSTGVPSKLPRRGRPGYELNFTNWLTREAKGKNVSVRLVGYRNCLHFERELGFNENTSRNG